MVLFRVRLSRPRRAARRTMSGAVLRKWEGPPKKVRAKPEVKLTTASKEAEDEIREMLRKPGWSADIKATLDFSIDEARRESYKRYIAKLPRQKQKPPA